MGTGPPKASRWNPQRGRVVGVSEKAIGKEVIQGTAADKQNQDCAPERSLGILISSCGTSPSDDDDRSNEQQQMQPVQRLKPP